MVATALSKTPNRTKDIKIRLRRGVELEVAGFLSSTINRWPATILAANRTERVMGRIKALTSSIKTMKGLRAAGLPKGTKWANIFWVFLTQAKITWPTHRGRARAKVKDKCLVEVKI